MEKPLKIDITGARSQSGATVNPYEPVAVTLSIELQMTEIELNRYKTKRLNLKDLDKIIEGRV